MILCHLECHCYFCRDGCVKCSNGVECALLVCVLCQPVPHAPIPFCYATPHNARTCGCTSSAHVHRRMANHRLKLIIYGLTPRSKSAHILREFPGYWWLFRTQHLSRYSARLVEEEKRNNSPFQVSPFN